MIVDVPRATYERLSRQTDQTSAAFGLALGDDKATTIVWLADQTVSLGAELSTEAASNNIKIQVAIKPLLDATRGMLMLEVEVSSSAADDQRQVKTTLSMSPSQTCAVVELPPASPSETLRLIVLSVSRR
jgi:hypothetical protein